MFWLCTDVNSTLSTEACALSVSPATNHWLVHFTKWTQSKVSYHLTYSEPSQERGGGVGGGR